MTPPDPEPIGIYPEAAPEHPPTAPREFKPWHKPRKQWVRENQWSSSIRSLIRSLQFRDGRPFRYLTLPGEDLLDIRVIHSVCDSASVDLQYLGYTERDPAVKGTQLNISLNEVAKLPRISARSRILDERFEMLADTTSAAFRASEDSGPFDAINIDLCDSLATPRQAGAQRVAPTYYEGLHHLLECQSANRSEPWLLLLTTRANSQAVYPNDAEVLWECVRSNIDANPDFRRRLEEIIQYNLEALIRDKSRIMTLPERIFVNLFGIGIGKWLLKQLLTATPPWTVIPEQLAHYSVRGGGPDMLSLVFRFTRTNTALEDPANLVRPAFRARSERVDEIALALGILEGYAQSVDVDQILLNNAPLRAELIERSAGLMAQARYDPAAYRAWAT